MSETDLVDLLILTLRVTELLENGAISLASINRDREYARLCGVAERVFVFRMHRISVTWCGRIRICVI